MEFLLFRAKFRQCFVMVCLCLLLFNTVSLHHKQLTYVHGIIFAVVGFRYWNVNFKIELMDNNLNYVTVLNSWLVNVRGVCKTLKI